MEETLKATPEAEASMRETLGKLGLPCDDDLQAITERLMWVTTVIRQRKIIESLKLEHGTLVSSPDGEGI